MKRSICFILIFVAQLYVYAGKPSSDPLIEKVREYLEERKENPESVREFYSDESRIWYGTKEGPGRLRGPSGSGAWAAWDRFFGSSGEIESISRNGRTVSVIRVETNGFYQLIDRAPSPVSLTYEFDESGRVSGTIVSAVSNRERAPDRFDEARDWIARHYPEDIEFLLPDGEINPSLDRAKRWKELLIEWRGSAGLPMPLDERMSCGAKPGIALQIRDERLTGSLAEAESKARRLLDCTDLAGEDRLELQLELAKILDRVGLHTNTRPVVEALEVLRDAESSADEKNAAAQAKIALALAEYFYRAEMGERKFSVATEHAMRAMKLFGQLDDPVGETDAVHRLGLIEMQKRNLKEADELFERSLVLSSKGPHRPIFLSDYHRHVGLVDMLSGDEAAAIAHFKTSLDYRNEAGSKDYGLFARVALGSAMTDNGRPEEARQYLEQALEIARELPSPVGELRATYYLGEMHEALGDSVEAVNAYRRADELATRLNVSGFQRASRDGLARLTAQSGDGNDAMGE